MPSIDLSSLTKISFGELNLEKIVSAILLFVILYVASRILMKMLGKVLTRFSLDRALTNFILAVCRVCLYILIGLIVADFLGVPTTSLVAVFSVAGLAISLSIQNTLSNLAGGVILLISKPFAADHYVEAGGVGGTVKEIGLIYTKVATPDNKIIHIPNSDISSSRITNYSIEEFRRVDVNYSASYDAPLETVKSALMQAIDQIPQILHDEGKQPTVAVTNYGESAIDYVVRVWVKNADYWSVLFALNEAVKYSFDANNVEMTYPHLNVHLVKDHPTSEDSSNQTTVTV